MLIRRAEGKVYETMVPEDGFDAWRQRLHIVTHTKTEDGIRLRFVIDSTDTGIVQDLDARPVTPTLEDAYVNLLRGTQIQDMER